MKTNDQYSFYQVQGPFPPLNIAIIGGGRACYDFLASILSGSLQKLNFKILGVASHIEDSPGYQYAKANNIFTTLNYPELYSIKDLNLIVELTGSDEIIQDILLNKPSTVSIIDHRAARVLWIPLIQEAGDNDFDSFLLYNKKQLQQTQSILDSLPYRIMMINDDLKIVMVNRAFINRIGQLKEDVIGKSCYKVRYGLDKPCNQYGKMCYFNKVKREGNLLTTIHEYKTPEGEQRFDLVTILPSFDEFGNIGQLMEASRDVTNRIKLEQEVKKTNTFLEKVIQSTVDGIVVVDKKGYVLIFNAGMERLTEYSAKEINHLTSFYNVDVARENMKKMRSNQYGSYGKLNPTSMSVTTKKGIEIPVTLSASIITINDEEMGSVGIFTDMREILNMKKNLKEAHLQLVQTEKIASFGKMAAGIAHEINNPLSGILIFSELLKESLNDNPQHLNDIQEIINQTLRCKKIVAELLEFSRQSLGHPSSFNLDDLIKQSLNFLVNQAIFQNITVNLKIEPEMPSIIGDFGQLQQVFTNLFINAADAMQGIGRLTIKACFKRRELQFDIEVADTGPGIPEKLESKVFDIFFTTKPVGRGTGLGLSITEKIIKLHGGNIRFKCPPEGGTIFFIRLPQECIQPSTREPVFIGLKE